MKQFLFILIFSPVFCFAQTSKSGPIKQVILGETMSDETWCYISTVDGKAYKADGSDRTKYALGLVYIGGAANDTSQLFLQGENPWTSSALTDTYIYYLSAATPGTMTTVRPAAGFWQMLCVATSDSTIIINPGDVVEDDKVPTYKGGVENATNRAGYNFLDGTGASVTVADNSTLGVKDVTVASYTPTYEEGTVNSTNRTGYNFLDGTGCTVTVADNSTLNVKNVTIASTAPRTRVNLSSDVTNNNATANTLADVTGLSFSVTNGTQYHFYAFIPYTSAATTTGSRWTVNCPTGTVRYRSQYTLTATTLTSRYESAKQSPSTSNASSLADGNIAIIEGVYDCTANGTFVIQFASEISSSAIVAKAGGYLEYW